MIQQLGKMNDTEKKGDNQVKKKKMKSSRTGGREQDSEYK